MIKRIGMSARQYAAHVGVTPQAIDKARMLGRLVLHPDGSIDAAASDKRRAEMTDPSQQRGRHAPDMKAATATGVTETLRKQGSPVEGGVSFANARTANEVMKAQLRRVELQRKKGEVVDKARATALVFQLARQERDAWVGWPARIAAIMAAEVGIGAHMMQTILEKHVHDHLEQLAEVRPEFR